MAYNTRANARALNSAIKSSLIGVGLGALGTGVSYAAKRKYSGTLTRGAFRGSRGSYRALGRPAAKRRATSGKKMSYRSSKTTARRVAALRKGFSQLKRRPTLRVGKRAVKVGRRFKAKVLEAVRSDTNHGQFHWQHGMALATADFSNIVTFWNGQSVAQDICIMGSPLQILNVASHLYNQKAFDADWTITTGNFPEEDFHCIVTSQRFDMLLKNNTQRVWKITLYECSPKNDQTNDPLADFNAILADEEWTALNPKPNRSATPMTSAGEGWYLGTGGAGTGILGTTGCNLRPEYLKRWKALWTHTQKTVIVKPGGALPHTMRIGNIEYKSELYSTSSGSVFRYHRGVTKAWFYRMEPEMSENVALNVGLQQAVSTRPHFSLSRHEHYFIVQPEATTDLPPLVAGGPVIASNKQDVYSFVTTFNLPTVPTALSRIDPITPVIFEGSQPTTSVYPV